MPIVKVTIPSKDKHISAMIKCFAFSVPTVKANKTLVVKGVTDASLQANGYLEFNFVDPADAKSFKDLLRWNLPGSVAKA